MKILTRYLLRAHVGPFFFAFVALTGVVLINTLARRLADLAGKGLPLDVVMEFFVLAVPATVALTFPMSVLVAVLYTFSQFTAENEVTALRASGVDLRRMTVPLFGTAALIALLMIWFNDRVLPESNHRWSQLWGDIARKTPTLVLQEQSVNQIRAGDGRTYFMRAARIDPATNRLWDVSIYDVTSPDVVRTIYADSGETRFNAARTDLILRLRDGHVRQTSQGQPNEFQVVAFREYSLPIPGVGNELNLNETGGYRSDREMTTAMLLGRIDTLRRERGQAVTDGSRTALADLEASLPATLRAKGTPPPPSGLAMTERARSTAETLRGAHTRVDDLSRQVREYEVEVQKKFSIAAATLVFVLIGAPLALRFPAGGIGMVIAASLLIFSLYYVGLIGGEELADRGHLSPAVAMWVMNAVMAVIGMVGFSRMGTETATARSGGWSLASLGALLADGTRRLRRGRAA